MKKIMIIDGGPRKKFNLAELFESFKEGVRSVTDAIEVKHIYLYDLDYKGCVSCMGCKLAGNKNYGRCLRKDDLSPLLEELKTVHGIVFGSPMYYMDVTGEMQSALERIIFPYGDYKSMRYEHRDIPTATFYTMNATPDYLANEGPMKTNIERVDLCVSLRWQKPERVAACCTMQVRDYSRYEFSDEWTNAHIAWRDAHWEEDKQKAYEAGVNMANKILNV